MNSKVLQESIEIKEEKADMVLWAPCSGECVNQLRRFLASESELPGEAAFDRVENASVDILSRCLSPSERSAPRRTGLIVGHVQSGKTISMTTVASLARDNGFGLIIVLAGTTDNLLDQSWKRFNRYLGYGGLTWQHWYMLTSAGRQLDQSADGLRNVLDQWRSGELPGARQTAFIVVMKNHAHLDQLTSVLQKVNPRGIPTLVIDDEADQAGLNTNPSGEPSTTYARIRQLRGTLGPHTYLQYTATPQAPLLINLADMLSPDFSVVLDSGDGYTGGETFFDIRRQDLVRPIPMIDLFKPGSPPQEPPESLLGALRVFLIGVALGRLRGGGKHRSMLVHPSPQRRDHDQYYLWVRGACIRWRDALRLASTDPDFVDTREEFEIAIAELQRTSLTIPGFDEILQPLQIALAQTQIWVVNSEAGTEIIWDRGYGHVLVGGLKLNRGYTVEGLTVTYMPRPPGSWNADTIQQLARFFGYKQGYIDLCRVYLHPEVLDAFVSYIFHERNLRTQLRQHPGPLSEWKRAFFLNKKLNPTRRKVLSDPIYREGTKPWVFQSSPYDASILDENRSLWKLLREKIGARWTPHPQSSRHQFAMVPLKELLETFLVDYRFMGDRDPVAFFAARCLLSDILEDDLNTNVSVVDMGQADRTARDGKIIKLHQGYDRKSHGASYPGAAKIVDGNLVTLQIHKLRVTIEDDNRGSPISDVPTLALHIPDAIRPSAMVVQSQAKDEDDE